MSQTWDFDYFALLVVVTGTGNTDSTGVGAAGSAVSWPFDYVNVIVAVTGSGNTDSTGVGAAGMPGVWPFDYWDGVTLTQGSGNTDSTGVGAATALGAANWYTITGVAVPVAVAAGSGNTDSTGVGTVGTYDPIPTVTGFGDTLSAGAAITLGTVVPPGGIRLSPYWEPGEIVYAYLLHEWLGSYEARLGAGAGPLVQIAYGDPDTTVAFGGLEPGQYVAVAGRKRVHFMVTP